MNRFSIPGIVHAIARRLGIERAPNAVSSETSSTESDFSSSQSAATDPDYSSPIHRQASLHKPASYSDQIETDPNMAVNSFSLEQERTAEYDALIETDPFLNVAAFRQDSSQPPSQQT